MLKLKIFITIILESTSRPCILEKDSHLFIGDISKQIPITYVLWLEVISSPLPRPQLLAVILCMAKICFTLRQFGLGDFIFPRR